MGGAETVRASLAGGAPVDVAAATARLGREAKVANDARVAVFVAAGAQGALFAGTQAGGAGSFGRLEACLEGLADRGKVVAHVALVGCVGGEGKRAFPARRMSHRVGARDGGAGLEGRVGVSSGGGGSGRTGTHAFIVRDKDGVEGGNPREVGQRGRVGRAGAEAGADCHYLLPGELKRVGGGHAEKGVAGGGGECMV